VVKPLPDEAAVIAAASAGDNVALGKLLVHYKPLMVKVAARIVPEQYIEDVTQNVAIAVLKNLHKFKGDSLFLTWLYRIVTNCGIDELRAQKQREREVGYFDLTELQDSEERYASMVVGQLLDESPEDRTAANQTIEQVFSCLSGLPDAHQAILMLRVQGYTNREIARQLEMPMGVLKVRLAEAKTHVARALGLK